MDLAYQLVQEHFVALEAVLAAAISVANRGAHGGGSGAAGGGGATAAADADAQQQHAAGGPAGAATATAAAAAAATATTATAALVGTSAGPAEAGTQPVQPVEPATVAMGDDDSHMEGMVPAEKRPTGATADLGGDGGTPTEDHERSKAHHRLNEKARAEQAVATAAADALAKAAEIEAGGGDGDCGAADEL